MLRDFTYSLILIFAAAAISGCGQVNVSIDPKSSTDLPLVQASKNSSIEVTVGSNLRKVTAGGYKVNATVGTPYSVTNQVTTPGGYKVRVGVTGLVAYTQ